MIDFYMIYGSSGKNKKGGKYLCDWLSVKFYFRDKDNQNNETLAKKSIDIVLDKYTKKEISEDEIISNCHITHNSLMQ